MFGFRKNKNKVNGIDLNDVIELHKVPEDFHPKGEIGQYVFMKKEDYQRVKDLGLDLLEMRDELFKDVPKVEDDPLYSIFDADGKDRRIMTEGYYFKNLLPIIRILCTMKNYDKNGKFLDEKTRIGMEREYQNLIHHEYATDFARSYDCDLHGLILAMAMSGFARATMKPFCDELSQKYRVLVQEKMDNPNIAHNYKELERKTKNMNALDSVFEFGETRTLTSVWESFWGYKAIGAYCNDLDKYMKFFFDLRMKWGLHDGKPEHDPIIGEMDKILKNKMTLMQASDVYAQMHFGCKDFSEFFMAEEPEFLDTMYAHRKDKEDEKLDFPQLDPSPDTQKRYTKIMMDYVSGLKKYYLSHMYGIDEDISYSGDIDIITNDLKMCLEAHFVMAFYRCAWNLQTFDELRIYDDMGNLKLPPRKELEEQGYINFNDDGSVKSLVEHNITDVKGFIAANVDIERSISYLKKARGETCETALGNLMAFPTAFYLDFVAVNMACLGTEGYDRPFDDAFVGNGRV